MFSKKISCNFKKVLSAVLSAIMVLGLFTVLTVAVPVTVSATTATEDAILIGKGSSLPNVGSTNPMVNIMLPIGAKSAGSGYSNFDGEVYFKLQFKCKMLSGTQPIVGMLRTNYQSGDGTYTEHAWCYNNDVGGSGENNSSYPATMSSYDSSTGTFTAIVRAWYNETNYYRNGRWCYLTIGDAEHNGNWYSARDLNASFIMSQPTLYAYNTSTGETYGDNLAPAFNDAGCDFNGTYFLRSSGAAQYDNPYYATSNKWHVDSAPALVNRITVPTNYNTSSNYNSGNFTKHGATSTTREYYTNTNYSDLYFEKVKYSNDKGFKVISNINKQMVIIEANHEGEADNRTTDGYQPTRNKPANLFIPINFGQYSMNGAATVDGNFLIKVSMTAKRLEGDGYPVLGRIVGKKSVGSGAGSQALGKMAKNLHLSGYYGAGSHETYTGGDFSYNESTGAFVGWMRVRRSDNDYATKWGNNEVITIGNAEHVWQEGTFDTTEFNSSFAISDLKVDVYTCTNPSSGVYAVDSLVAEDVAPGFTAENLDTTSNWVYQFSGSASNHGGDCIRGNQYKWSVDGDTGMVHNEDITACIANSHELEHHSATETAVEYWGCATCQKIFADPYGKRQVPGNSATLTDKMVCIESANNKSSAFIPVNLNGFDGGTKQWYKFTCKVKCIGDGVPVVSTLYNKYTGNQCETTQPDSNDGDMAVIESSYDATTQTLTGYIKAWVPTYNKAARYPYIRYNPVSGANVAIVVGNGRYIGNGYTDQATDTSFAIATPTLHKIDWYGATDTLASAKEADVLGDNLIAPISDKTVDFSTSWSLTWTDSNNPLSAPMGYWHKLAYDTNNVTCVDLPAGFFESADVDGDPKMLRLAGAGSTTNQQALSLETHLDANTTYQFDLDYRAFGGAEAYINIQTAAEGGSYNSTLVTYTNTSSNVEGAHRSVRFTMPSNARSTNNFKVYIGQKYPLKTTGSVYFANAALRQVSGNSLGDNIFVNGDFHKGLPGVVTSSAAPTVFYGWGQIDVLNYPSVTLMPIPDGFFSGTAVSGDNTIALKATGGNYVEIQFRVELKPSTYYRFQYDYRNIGDLPKLDYQANGTVTMTKVSDNSDNKYRMTYQIYSDGTNTAAANGAAGNTRIRLKFGASSSGKTAYINNVKLFELTGANGSTVGSNMVGNLNAVYDESYYNQLGENNGDSLDVTLTQDVNTNVKRNLANSWFGAYYNSDTVTQQLVRVPGDFFNYLDYNARITLLRKAVIGVKNSDGINPHYNPNNDDTWADVRDLVHAKLAAIASQNAPEEKQITINNNPLSEYAIFNDGAASNAVSAVDTVLEEYLETEVDLSTASQMPTSGKAIRIASDNAVSPGKCRVSVDGNTLNITAYRKEFTAQAIDGFTSLLSGNSVNLASGFSREFNIATEAYSSGSDKRIIGGSTANSIGYTCGQTATIRVAAVSLNDAKILTGVPYYKINIFNETTGGTTSEQYVTPTNGVYEFTVTSGNTPGYIFWSVIACDSSKNRLTAFSTVDSDNRNFAGSVGFNVSSISAKSTKPSNFESYWQGVASGITTTGYTLDSVSANSGYNAYLVKIPCGTDINGNQGYATGYLTVPSNASASNKIKLKLKFQSYSVTAPGKLYEANTAYFHVCAHSMDISSSSNSSISAVSAYRDQYGLNYDASTVEQTYYYQMIRRDLTAGKFMLDYFGSSGNNYWNGTDFEATGGSMGGFQSTAVAALLKYTNAANKGISFLNIEIPYMCDLNGTGNGRLTRTWGTKYTDRLKYFDTTYFGSMVTCKTRIFAGLGDTICPASGTTVLYNSIPASDKQITYRQGATHNEYGSGAEFTKTP